MAFIRVRDVRTNHEYDANEELVALYPKNYEVLDKEPVTNPRPAKHFVPAPDGEGITPKPVGKSTKEK